MAPSKNPNQRDANTTVSDSETIVLTSGAERANDEQIKEKFPNAFDQMPFKRRLLEEINSKKREIIKMLRIHLDEDYSELMKARIQNLIDEIESKIRTFNFLFTVKNQCGYLAIYKMEEGEC